MWSDVPCAFNGHPSQVGVPAPRAILKEICGFAIVCLPSDHAPTSCVASHMNVRKIGLKSEAHWLARNGKQRFVQEMAILHDGGGGTSLPSLQASLRTCHVQDA